MSLAGLALTIWMGTAAAWELPEKIGFAIWVEGEPIGRCDITVTTDETTIYMKSKVEVSYIDFTLSLVTSTEADSKTFLVRQFEYAGEKMGKEMRGEVQIDGRILEGFTVSDGAEFPSSRQMAREQTIVFEDYVIGLQILAALALEASGESALQYNLVFASNLSVADLGLYYASDVALESHIKEAICRKIQYEIGGSSPFVAFWDEKSKLPVYTVFPANNTELFLDAFFGEEPLSRYRSN